MYETSKRVPNRWLIILLALTTITGCYHRSFSLLHPPHEGQELEQKDVSIRMKPLRDFECSHYFNSRLLSRNVQPLQVYVQNKSDKVYVLDASKLSLPLVSKGGIGVTLYRNIVARSVVWFVGSLFLYKVFIPILLIDNILSMHFNQDMKRDIESVCIQSRDKIVIQPKSRLHKVLFIPADKYNHHLSIILQEQDSENELVFSF